MERATPVQMRKALEVVNEFKRMGIRFVPVPVLCDADEEALQAMVQNKLKTMETIAELADVSRDAKGLYTKESIG